ncbi:hypothetical protein L5515_019413 [Caenorhabditis briggsae]|uniref:C2H2-type domain-containing protein n=1 Tax=Caenorhabditis briggsae TaxID=6238 RepID=A0AAE9FEQ1_CAEBR|nr:hypothetical protein L5515_019413 [Caenorhabditis briggsae]
MPKEKPVGRPRKTGPPKPSRGVGRPKSSGPSRSGDRSREATQLFVQCGRCKCLFDYQHWQAVHMNTCVTVKQCPICNQNLGANENMCTHIENKHFMSQEEHDKMENDAVDELLREGKFSQVELTLPIVWLQIVEQAAERIAEKLKKKLEENAKVI